jgi:hypothetical protein
MAVGLPVICFKNEFNISLLEGNAIYIKDFFDILSIQKQKESNKIYPAEICWNKIIKKLINNYLILE